jgi:hypothetical protein
MITRDCGKVRTKQNRLNLTSVDSDQEENALFIIPSNINLSHNQTATLSSHGRQQRGMPFCVGEQGLFRPPSHCLRLGCTRLHAAILQNSARLNRADNDLYSVSFEYNTLPETRLFLIIYTHGAEYKG